MPKSPIDDLAAWPTNGDAWEAGLAAAFSLDEVHQNPLKRLRRDEQFAPTAAGAPPIVLRDSRAEGEPPLVQTRTSEMPADGRVGRYRLHGEIARGGMGAILHGRDVVLGRELAVKVLLSSHQHKPEVARRFIEEAQIAGQLQHPGIAPVYEMGEFDDHRPFFAMKLVKGQTLASLLNKRKDLTHDRPRLLGVFEQVCQTMAYAHSRGVIHRDLKPANVMVGAFGEVQVMDWGLAKVLAEGGLADEPTTRSASAAPRSVSRVEGRGSTRAGTETDAGAVLGTPAFMSPEQAAGDVDRLDERCDVFGLGAILCAILTGSPPYVAAERDDVLAKAKCGELTAAFERMDASGADAGLIQLAKRCLATEPGDRPHDASIVAAELSEHLRSVELRLREAELAQARAQTKAHEERKRRRVTLALAASIVATIVVAGLAWGYVVHQQSTRESQLAARRIALAQQIGDVLVEAERLKAQAQAAPWGDNVSIMKARETARRADALVNSGPVEPALADRVRRLTAEIDDEAKHRELAAELEAARTVQAEIDPTEGRFLSESAIPAYEQAFASAQIVVSQSSPNDAAAWVRTRPEPLPEMLIAALDHWILLEEERGSGPDRLAWLRQVVEKADDNTWRRRVRRMVEDRDFAAVVKTLEEAEAQQQSATVLNTLATWLVHAERRTEAVTLLRRAQRRHPGDFWINSNLGMWSAQLDPPQFDDAIRFTTVAVSLRPRNAGAHLNLGVILAWRQDAEGAIAAARQALEIEPNFAKAHTNLAGGLTLLKRYDEALQSHRAALALTPNWPDAHYALGLTLLAMEDFEAALAEFRTSLELNPKDGRYYYHVAMALSELDRRDEALAVVRQGIQRDAEYVPLYNLLGLVLQAQGDLAGAKHAYEQCLAKSPTRHEALHNLGNVYLSLKQPRQAVAYFLAALELKPDYADAHNNLGVALKDLGELEAAIESHKKAIAVDPGDAKAYNNLGLALMRAGRGAKESIVAFEKAVEVQPDLSEAYMGLGLSLRRVGRFDESLAAFKKGTASGFREPAQRKQARVLIAEAEEFVRLHAALDEVLNGLRQPLDAEERLKFARICYYTGRFQDGVRLHVTALGETPALVDDLSVGYRYDAACAAALAAAGGDAGTVSDDECQRLRTQALAWLEQDLAARRKQLASGKSADAEEVRRAMRYWQRDVDLAVLREPQGNQPETDDVKDRRLRLWEGVAALLWRAEQEE